MRRSLTILLGLALVLSAAGPAGASHEIVIGLQCDRTGATQTVGVKLCPGYHDYIALVNSRGGVEGHMLKAIEIDHEYKVPPGVESYERHKKEGAVIIGGLGSVLGSIFGAIFVTLLPIVIRYAMEAFGGVFFEPQTVLNLIPNLRLMLFGALIIFFLIVEPEGLNRLWRNIRSYFRVWPFAY